MASGADPTICTSEGRSAIDIVRQVNQEIPTEIRFQDFFDLQVGDGPGGGISTKEAMILNSKGLFRVNSYVGFWGSDLE